VDTGSARGDQEAANPSFAEPRVACPFCGAHVIEEARVTDRVVMSCPVCGLRWTASRPPGHEDSDQRPR